MNTQEKKMVYGNLIGGKWLISNQTYPVYNKHTGDVIADISIASKEDVHAAVGNAVETFKTHELSPYNRYEILLKAAHLIRERKEELALNIVREGGKVLKDARSEVERGIQTFIASAEEAKRIAGKEIPLQGQPGNEGKMAFTIRVPVGVVCAITPFNFPLNLTAHKIAPALAAGNAVVLKPAAVTPLSAIALACILQEAGLPDGFLNIVNGSGAEIGPYLLEDPRISLFTFTGSPEVGAQIKSKSGIRKVILELGNNSPNIVHMDAPDVKKAARLCITKGFINNGQACISVQRIYVHREVYKEFVDYAILAAEQLRKGDPELEDADIGPMISVKEAERAERWILEAVQDGAQIAVGGTRNGSLLQPTILTEVTSKMKVVCEEVFAPVVSIIAYDDIDEAIELANDSRFGLQAGLFTSNIQLAFKAAKKLEFGGVIINDVSTFRTDIMPYGGVKDSGFGKEGPAYAVQEMTEERIIVFDL